MEGHCKKVANYKLGRETLQETYHARNWTSSLQNGEKINLGFF